MFDLRPSKLSLRRESENRAWKSNESFADYYHDKLILGNRVPVAQDELIDYIIDGILDAQLKHNARLMRFKNTGDLLETCDKIFLDLKKL